MLGLKEVKIGEEAIVYPHTFALAGSKTKNLRNSISSAERHGVDVRILEMQGLDGRTAADLQRISWEWQKMGKKNIGFSTTKFEDIKSILGEKTLLSVAYADGKACAFATFRIYPDDHGAALDVLRRSKGAPAGAVEMMIHKIILYLKSRPEIGEFSLGLAPLADSLEEVDSRSLLEKIAFRIGKKCTLIYNYDSLFRFKDKFNPRWDPRYLVVPGNTSLPRVLYSIYIVHMR